MAGESAKRQPFKRIGLFSLLSHQGGSIRYWEIDALRGVAILMMVVYHLAYDLTLFGYYRENVFVGPWRVWARITATLFILLAGVSLAISQARAEQRAAGGRNLFRRHLMRGLSLVGWGLVITLITWIYMGRPVVIFGILHLIGAATILAYPFLSRPWPSLALGTVLIPVGMYLNRLPVSHPWLLLLGLRPRTLYQLDYFPLLPWFGVVLLGVFAGRLLYSGGVRRFTSPERGEWMGVRELAWLGQRSLAIYLVHQPFLFTLLTVASLVGLRNLVS
jgi:uncharacterized membrane protein